jgi:hypothetical protein
MASPLPPGFATRRRWRRGSGLKSPLVERSLCSIPWQDDFPRGNVSTVKGALSVHWKLDDRPISVKLYEFAAIDGPEQTGAAEMHQRIIAMATEQGPRIPAQFGGALGPVFGQVQEAMAIAHKLTPTVPRDVRGWTIIVEAGDPLDPIDWNAPFCANGLARNRGSCRSSITIARQFPTPAAVSSKASPNRSYA